MKASRHFSNGQKPYSKPIEKKTFRAFDGVDLPAVDEYVRLVAIAFSTGVEGLASSGNREVGERLKRARLGALFTSADQAAIKHGWVAPTYVAAEQGLRPVTEERLAIYAAAFGVPVEWIMSGDTCAIHDLDTGDSRVRHLDIVFRAPLKLIRSLLQGVDPRIGSGPHTRLRSARVMAGYRSARAFAQAVDVSRTTYTGHENGSPAYSIESAHLYAVALGVSAAWLLYGQKPSGLPVTSEWTDDDYDRDVDDAQLARRPPPDEARRGTLARIADARRAVLGDKALDDGLKLLAVPELEFDSDGKGRTRSTWSIPAERLPTPSESEGKSYAIVRASRDGAECLALIRLGDDGLPSTMAYLERGASIVEIAAHRGAIPPNANILGPVSRYLMLDA